jgi:tubby and related proteins
MDGLDKLIKTRNQLKSQCTHFNPFFLFLLVRFSRFINFSELKPTFLANGPKIRLVYPFQFMIFFILVLPIFVLYVLVIIIILLLSKIRSNFLGTKFTIFDSQPPSDAAVPPTSRITRNRINSKQVSPRIPAGNYEIATIAYELNMLRTRGPRRMHCTMHHITLSSLETDGTAPTPVDTVHTENPLEEQFTNMNLSQGKGTTTVHGPDANNNGELLVLKNKAPRWHEQLQCWCLNFRGRVTVASVKNFQLVAAPVDQPTQVSPVELEKVILQFGKIGKDIFTMDYCYPLSAFQAFAICLTSFDTKPACE